MRPVEELINVFEPSWTMVKSWIETAKNKVEILDVDESKATQALYQTQVTTRSPMGAIIYMTGGILIDDGWIRILGSGHLSLNRTLPEWNKGKSFKEFGEGSPFLLIADDVIGGFFLLNGGGLGTDLGKVYYFAPDSLEYESLDLSYSEFLQFCFNNDLEKFYEGNRWTQWREEVSKLDGNTVINFYPFLWTREGRNINNISRKAIPIEEQYIFNINMRKQLELDK